MRFGLVVDAGCDLPQEFLEEENVVVLPIMVRLSEQLIVDRREDSVTRQFLDRGIAKDAAEAETIPYTVDEIKSLFLDRLVVEYDYVMVQTIAGSRSPIYERSVQASLKILNEYHPIRMGAGIKGPFNMRVADTGSLFSGQALAAWEALRLRKVEGNPQLIRNRVDRVIANLHTTLVTPDLYYLRNRARAKGDRAVGLMSVALGSALDIKPLLYCNEGDTRPVAKVRGFEPACEKMLAHVARQVDKGLLVPAVTLSYGGDLAVMRALPGYGTLRTACDRAGIPLVESMMSLTGVINTGPGTLSVAYAQEGPQHFV